MTILVLGPFRLDTQDALLFRGREPVTLGRRAVALLRVLAEQPGVLVSKGALIEAAWPGQTVEDSNLTVQIAAVRRVLGEVSGGEQWIETMPRRGYRFVGPVGSDAGDRDTVPVAKSLSEPADGSRGAADRRPITAMSCELVGTSGRLDGISLEDLRSAVGTFQRCVAETAERHEGLVVSQLGNAALVLFGYPTAHEHDAEQAVRAGIALCGAIRGVDADLVMRCRVGIATSMTIIGTLAPNGGPVVQEIVGDAPNLAAQLRLLAPPDVVATEPVTRGLIGTLFDCRELGAVVTTGSGEPIPVWQVLGDGIIDNRFEALRGSALTRLVGRDEEIALLMRRWARATAGEGQVVLVSGEPGIGKSRLTATVEERLADEAHGRLQYFCSPHHQDSALFPFADRLQRASGFTRDDKPAARLVKLEALLAGAGVAYADVTMLADLLALPVPERGGLSSLSPQRKKERTLEALIRMLEHQARRQPMVVIFEDAHWIDATSRELLDLAVEHVRGLPVLLIVTFRPEFKPPWTGQAHVTMLALNRLDRRDRIALATQVAGKALPEVVLEQIADRTDGVPLFVEELTKSVVESGRLRPESDRYVLDGTLPSLAIPTSLYASLLARLDHPASARLVAQAGAAIGREFPYGLLRAVTSLPDAVLQGALGRLVASELVFQRGVAPEAVYRFKHALVQDVAYGSLLREARQRLHASIAQALEAQSPELLETQPELFAQHYAEAGLVEKSVAAWAQAGQRSASRSALAEAAAQYQKALDQLALLPEGPDRLRQELDFRSALGALLRFVKGQAAPETGEAYARTRALWEQLGSPPAFRHVPYGQSMCHVYRGELDLAQRVGEELLELSRARDDAAGMVLGHSATGQSLMLAGRFEVSQPHFEALLGLYDPDAHATLVHQTGSHPLMTQAFLGLAQFCLGFPEQAMTRTEAAIADARRLKHPTSLAVGLAIGTLLDSLVGDHAAAGRRADQLASVADEQGMPFFRAWGAIYRGRSRIGLGDVAGGMPLLTGGVSAYRDTGSVMWLPHFVALLAAGHEAAGQIEVAEALLDEAIQTVAQTGERWFAAELNRQKGWLLERQGRAGAADDLYRRALDIAREQDARLWQLRAAVSLARLHSEQRLVVEADGLLAGIYGWFVEGFATPDLVAAKSLLDQVQAEPTATDGFAAGGVLVAEPVVIKSPPG